MNFPKFSKLFGASVIAVSLAVVPLTVPAQAQNNAPDTSTSTQRNTNVDARGPISKNTNRDDNNDLGWFGLIGLAGLAGLAGKKRRETVRYSDSNPDVTVRSGNNYR